MWGDQRRAEPIGASPSSTRASPRQWPSSVGAATFQCQARCSGAPACRTPSPSPGELHPLTLEGAGASLFPPSSPVPITNTGDLLRAAGEVLEGQHLGRDWSSVWPGHSVEPGSPTRAAHSALPLFPLEPVSPRRPQRRALLFSNTAETGRHQIFNVINPGEAVVVCTFRMDQDSISRGKNKSKIILRSLKLSPFF